MSPCRTLLGLLRGGLFAGVGLVSPDDSELCRFISSLGKLMRGTSREASDALVFLLSRTVCARISLGRAL